MQKKYVLSVISFLLSTSIFAGGNEPVTSLSAGGASNNTYGKGGAISFRLKNPSDHKIDLRVNLIGLNDKNQTSRGIADAKFMYGFPVGEHGYFGGNLQLGSTPLMQAGGLGLSYSREGDVNTINVDLNYLVANQTVLSADSRPTISAPNLTLEMEQRLDGTRNKDALVLTESATIGGLTLNQSTFIPGFSTGTFYDETEDKMMNGSYSKLSLGIQKSLGQRVALRFEVINETVDPKYEQTNTYSIAGYPIGQIHKQESGKKSNTTGLATLVIKLN